MSTVSLNLFCIVYPDDNPTDHVLEVSIDNTKSVAALKEAIKHMEAPELDRASRLALYKVSLPIDDNLAHKLDTFLDGPDVKKIKGFERLSKVFSEGINEEHLHIVALMPGTSPTLPG